MEELGVWMVSAMAAWAGGAEAQMVIDSGMQSGTYGEPLEDVVLLQGCVFEQEVPSCELASNGFTYWVSWDDPTPGYVLEAMAALYVNAPLWIRADIVSMGDMSAEIAVHALRHDAALDPFAEIRANLQGSWVFDADPAYTSRVWGDRVTEEINGDFSAEYTMQIAESCEASQGQGPVLIAHMDPWSTPPCMILEAVTPQKLILQMAGGDGTLFKYRRP
ncbi:hypothetical protein J7382_07225 [Shimia sp. R11_0]|uniref:hypothetical protein n=1 Tax=Shimia sp. R11_0 TaxID=2821096 RepID=UPI001AD9565A|nr:hypothetical protein [Shimia sp. R11_0]MBO9477319.1 hypothetical protein [Shimia sp. R11_0]